MNKKQEQKMVTQAEGRFINRKTPVKGKTYDRFFIYIPTELARDSAFPFKEGDKVKVRIEGNKLIIEKS